MLLLFIAVFIVICVINLFVLKIGMNSFIIVFIPYAMIVAFNNLFLTTYFYSINDRTILFLITIMIVYEIVVVFVNLFAWNYKKRLKKNEQSLGRNFEPSHFNYTFIEIFTILAIAVKFAQVVYIYLTQGFAAIGGNDFENMKSGVIVNRIILLLYPAGWLLWVRFLYGKDLSVKSKIKYLILVLLVLLVHFLDATKAHSLIYLLGLFFIAAVYKKRNVLIGFVALTFLVLFLFFSNYALSWLGVDGSVPSIEYTLVHAWKYVSSGTININTFLSESASNGSFFDYWLDVFSPIPNEFYSAITGKSIPMQVSFSFLQNDGPLVSHTFNERSNVISLFAFFFSDKNPLSLILNVGIFAVINESCTICFKSSKSASLRLFSLVVVLFAFVSFFSCYYRHAPFWQILLYTPLFVFISKRRFTRNRFILKEVSA